MKARNNMKGVAHCFWGLVSIMLLGFLLSGCEDQVRAWEKKSSTLVITEYVKSEPELFSEFEQAIQITGIENLLRVRGPFTLLLPTNAAMQAYYGRLGVASSADIDVEELKKMVYNHIFQGEISTASMGLGTLPFENALGDFVASDLPGSDILLNKVATIIKRDIRVANGYVQHIDHVLEPITKSVYEVLAEYSGYSIFLEGLNRAGLADTLKLNEFPYGNAMARNRYTLLAVLDETYASEGVNSIEDLINKYKTDGALTDPNNGFYQYMEYHCLSGTHYFSGFTAGDKGGNYYLISQNNYLNIRVGKDFEINKTDSGYTGFYYDLSNIPAKNGTIHTVNTLLPVVDSDPTEIIFQVTDYFDFQQGSYYQHHYERFYDGDSTFKYIKWQAEYLMYYFKNEMSFMDADGLSLNGHFWIEVTTPKIKAGKYELSTWSFGGAIVAWYMDGVYLDQVDIGSSWDQYLVIGEVEFTETKNHVIRVQSTVPGNIFWDRVKFSPL